MPPNLFFIRNYCEGRSQISISQSLRGQPRVHPVIFDRIKARKLPFIRAYKTLHCCKQERNSRISIVGFRWSLREQRARSVALSRMVWRDCGEHARLQLILLRANIMYGIVEQDADQLMLFWLSAAGDAERYDNWYSSCLFTLHTNVNQR